MVGTLHNFFSSNYDFSQQMILVDLFDQISIEKIQYQIYGHLNSQLFQIVFQQNDWLDRPQYQDKYLGFHKAP